MLEVLHLAADGSNHDARVADFDPSGRYPKEKRHIGEKFSSNLFSDSAINFLKEHKDDQPFLMYVAYTAPHDPRMAPKEYADMYKAHFPDTAIVLRLFKPGLEASDEMGERKQEYDV